MVMDEIVDEDHELRPLNNQGLHSNTVEILVRTVGPARPARLVVPSPIKVCDLRKLIAENNGLPIENLRLILRGNVLNDSKNGDQALLQLNNRDSLIVAVKPKPPNKNTEDWLDDDDDNDDEDLKFRLPESSSKWKKKLYSILHEKLKLPDILLMGIFSLSLKGWVGIIMWFILASVANRWNLGPLYMICLLTKILSSTPKMFFTPKKILGTGFAIILLNLGKRQPGDVSAYSIFNENFRELPGTLNADRLDRDIRADPEDRRDLITIATLPRSNLYSRLELGSIKRYRYLLRHQYRK